MKDFIMNWVLLWLPLHNVTSIMSLLNKMKFEYNTTDYIRKINKGNSYFDTFLNKNSLAAGILILKPGEEDTQIPHDSDEMYYILEGDGFLKIKNKNYSIKKGKAFFVPKNTEHYFFGNKKKLQVLYFFGGPDD